MTDEMDPIAAEEASAFLAAAAADDVPALVAADASPSAAGASQLPAADASLLALVDRLAGLLERSDLLELEVEAGGTAITLRKSGALAGFGQVSLAAADGAATARASIPGRLASPAGPGMATASDPATPVRAAVLAPLTGIFYSSPSPGSAPFVAAGREVVVGQVIGLIEAMKLFNEIKSDRAGRVVRVVPDNGTLVKAKQPLIEVEPL